MLSEYRSEVARCETTPSGGACVAAWWRQAHFSDSDRPENSSAEPRSFPHVVVHGGAKIKSMLFVGSFDERSGLKYLFYAFSAVRVLVPGATLILRGSDALPPYFVKLAKQLEIFDAISLVQIFGAEELSSAILGSKGLVMPALSSSSGVDQIERIAIASALALDRPIVATYEAAGASSVTDGLDGYLHAKCETNGFARSMIKILQQSGFAS